ncbi:MAG: aconitate hydratase AcnA, partial [Planctomycetota bacterium]
LPICIRVLLESALRNNDGFAITDEHVKIIANWSPDSAGQVEVPFMPARVILQDFTGVPSLVDLAALRSAMQRLGKDPQRINPQVPADLVIDHSIQVDFFGTRASLEKNNAREFERNRERYEFLHWGQKAFKDFRVVPPASGIVHQVNLEYLASVVTTRDVNGTMCAFPDSLVGTDSHTTMINGIGVVAWGVGGIEAEAVMLGQPIFMILPEVVGVEITGRMPEGATATDLVLRVTEMLRKHGVVEKLVEFHGSGLDSLSLADRATIANMAPEYGATTGFFPVDDETLNYLRRTGREQLVPVVETYCKANMLWRGSGKATYSEHLSLDLGTIEPAMAGPKRPQDRVAVKNLKTAFFDCLKKDFAVVVAATRPASGGGNSNGDVARLVSVGGASSAVATLATRTDTYHSQRVPISINGMDTFITHGAVVIAAITSCTNTSNPGVLIGAGLLAKKAIERGLNTKPWVKTSLAPGSRVVTSYLERAGVMPYLEALHFHTVGYGCTTCIGNSGPLPDAVANAITEGNLVAASVLSGNRNFEGRVNPHTRANYLASPPLVVAAAIAGTVDIDFNNEPLGFSPDGEPVFLRDIWPSQQEISDAVAACVSPELFQKEYGGIFTSNEQWNAITGSDGDLYKWNADSTYIQEPPFFQGLTVDVPPIQPIRGARLLALLGDSVTTDHISPAGAIPKNSPAESYLLARGVAREDFNSFGSRRGNHEVMMRGTFGNIRLKNHLAHDGSGKIKEGNWTTDRRGMISSIYDASMDWQEHKVPLVICAGKDYGMGSSRDWAAKGAFLLGVRAVIAESFERIHRSNLVFMGVLPLVFQNGQTWQSLGIKGDEKFDIELPAEVTPGCTVKVTAGDKTFHATARLDSAVEIRYWQNGGILHTVLRDMAKG